VATLVLLTLISDQDWTISHYASLSTEPATEYCRSTCALSRNTGRILLKQCRSKRETCIRPCGMSPFQGIVLQHTLCSTATWMWCPRWLTQTHSRMLLRQPTDTSQATRSSAHTSSQWIATYYHLSTFITHIYTVFQLMLCFCLLLHKLFPYRICR